MSLIKFICNDETSHSKETAREIGKASRKADQYQLVSVEVYKTRGSKRQRIRKQNKTTESEREQKRKLAMEEKRQITCLIFEAGGKKKQTYWSYIMIPRDAVRGGRTKEEEEENDG